MMNKALTEITDKIIQCQRIAITSHLRPDGDSICTSLALYYMGKSLGKHVEIINKDNTPSPFNLFPDSGCITIGSIPPDKFDLVILLECANISRSGQKHLDNYFKINIDHHHSNDFYADINWVEPEAPAVACMAYDLGKALNIIFTPEISNHLYCAIVSDTGSFQFSNTNTMAFEISYHLTKEGADPLIISELLFHNNPPEKIKLLGRVLSRLKMFYQGKIAVITMFKDDLTDLKLNKEIDSEYITTLVRSIKDTQIVLFFKEMKKNTFRVSIRSKGNANSAQVAEHFGGGGHLHAAGFTVTGNYDNLIKDVPEKVAFLLKKRLNLDYSQAGIDVDANNIKH